MTDTTALLTDPVRIASMVLFAPFIARAAWRRVQGYRYARIIRRRVLSLERKPS